MSELPTIAVGLSKYVDDSGETPVILGTDVPVNTIAYRALSGSWCLSELAFQFSLSDAQILAALLYYSQYRTVIEDKEGSFHLELEAMD